MPCILFEIKGSGPEYLLYFSNVFFKLFSFKKQTNVVSGEMTFKIRFLVLKKREDFVR